jgi:hypothetical protein
MLKYGMTKISKSPERHTFQADNYVKRCEEEGNEPSEDYLNLFKSWRQQDEENMTDPKWQKDNLEYDLRSTEWILEKVRGDDVYAQNLYAAMCNNDFTKREMWPILKEQKWSCSWRHAGGIVADMKQEGDYIDWYCSGIRNDGYLDDPADPSELTIEQEAIRKKFAAYVPESVVTDEIENDLFRLGWLVVKYDDTKDI